MPIGPFVPYLAHTLNIYGMANETCLSVVHQFLER